MPTPPAAWMVSGRYVAEILDLYDFFYERLPAVGIVYLSAEAYRAGTDRVRDPHARLIGEAVREWSHRRDYLPDRRQLAVSFFAAASARKLIHIHG